MTQKLLEVRDIQISRDGRTILDVESLQIDAGEILAVVGPNGAGKSTLVKAMALLVRPDRGDVFIGGEKATAAREHALRSRLACVFQTPHLLDRSVRVNVELGMKLRRVSREQRRERADRWLDALGLRHLADSRATTLSGGEAQRVNLARALALAPEALLLDEPLGGLDAPTRHALSDELGPLVRRGAGAGLLVTHDRRDALLLGDRVAVMMGGRVRQVGPPEDVFARPMDKDVARFLGVDNLLNGRGAGDRVVLGNGATLRREAGGLDGDVVVCLRAEDVRLASENFDGPEKDGSSLRGTLLKVVRRGVEYAFEVDVGVRLVGRMTRPEYLALEPKEGDACAVRIRPSALHCIPNPR